MAAKIVSPVQFHDVHICPWQQFRKSAFYLEVWRRNRYHSQVNQAVVYVSKHLPVFTSRDAQKSFMSIYSHISKVSKSLLRNIFKNLTWDQTAAPTGMTIIV